MQLDLARGVSHTLRFPDILRRSNTLQKCLASGKTELEKCTSHQENPKAFFLVIDE